MVRVLSLLWTFGLAILTTCLSFFYVQSEFRHGFPLTFSSEVVASDGTLAYKTSFWLIAIDVIIWWLLFSMLWIMVRNYILELD